MQTRYSGIEIFMLVEYSATDVERVSVDLSRGECRVIAVSAENNVAAVEAAVYKPQLCTNDHTPLEQLEAVCIVEIQVLVGEKTDSIVYYT